MAYAVVNNGLAKFELVSSVYLEYTWYPAVGVAGVFEKPRNRMNGIRMLPQKQPTLLQRQVDPAYACFKFNSHAMYHKLMYTDWGC